jgi:hypothetical protein
MNRSLILLIAVTFLLQSCAKIFYTPDATPLARAQKVIAIAPPKVAIAVALLFDVWGATNEATVSLSIHDQSANKMIWNFNHKLSSSLGSPAGLVDALMRQASREMPYFMNMNSL